jgi:beta-fructofuranosidase
MPRHIWLDPLATTNLIQWPIAEVDALRQKAVTQKNVVLETGSTVELVGANGAQLDIEVHFAMPNRSEGLEQANELLAEDGQLQCSAIVAGHGVGAHSYGPFGVHVLASQDLQERTSIFFYLLHDGQHANWKTLFCADHSLSSLQQDVDKTTYGSYVRIHQSDNVLSIRLLVDHSIVESFAQGGRTVITSRVYPELAVKSSVRAFLFNNGTETVTVKSVTAWDMASVDLKDF